MVVEAETEDDGILRVFNRSSWKIFEMDKVFGPSSTQEQVIKYLGVMHCSVLLVL